MCSMKSSGDSGPFVCAGHFLMPHYGAMSSLSVSPDWLQYKAATVYPSHDECNFTSHCSRRKLNELLLAVCSSSVSHHTVSGLVAVPFRPPNRTDDVSCHDSECILKHVSGAANRHCEQQHCQIE